MAKRDTPVGLGTLAYYLLITYVLLIAAIWTAVQGDWLPAIFFAVLWTGHTNNVGSTISRQSAVWRWKKEHNIT